MTSAQTEVVNMENKTAIFYRTKDLTALLDEHTIYADYLPGELKDFVDKFYKIYLTKKPKLKDIYDIVVGIGEVWNDISDIDQAALLNKLAGMVCRYVQKCA